MGIGRSGPDYSQITVKGLIGSFYDTLEAELAGSWATKLGVVIPSNQSIETYRWLGLPPQMRLWLNARHVKGLPVRSFTIENQTYESTLGVDRDELKFDKTGQLMIRMGEHAALAARHWEKLTSELIETDGLCYDGQNFFDTDHVMGGENTSTYKNELTSNEVASLNVTTATKPTATEMRDVIIGCVEYQYTFKDNSNEPLNQGARKFALMVNPNMMGSALAAVRADRLDSSGGNDNTLKTQDFQVEVIVNPRLTSTDVVYLFRTDGRMKPFILQDAVAPTVDFLGEGSDRAFLTNQYLFGVRAVRAAGYGQWAHALKATLG
jgi:phage major head subunit gpT-like protein